MVEKEAVIKSRSSHCISRSFFLMQAGPGRLKFNINLAHLLRPGTMPRDFYNYKPQKAMAKSGTDQIQNESVPLTPQQAARKQYEEKYVL